MSSHPNVILMKTLREFGLSEKEVAIYLALLQADDTSVQTIAKSAGVNRSSAYVVLESLRKKGYVNLSPDQQGQKYVAVPPDMLLRHAEDDARERNVLKEKIAGLMPDLRAIHKDNKYRPNVRVFEGTDGVREVYYSIFSTRAKTLKVYADPQHIFRALPDFMEHDRERAKRGIKMYAINPATKENIELMKHIPPDMHAELLLIPPKHFTMSSDMGIYDDFIALVSPKEKFGIIIESKEMARTVEANFDMAWEEAKRLNKLHKLPRT